ncbi:MAG: bifunctional proline dehydrogenase/L-glutamate gamma-semialdehyde dehydrogenase [Akkermansiaceae bacterium]|nr:bifunctional proline dehydrogenase/L-glutamate gamma-semialdehyde dehydrogenase [Armatimonadota bacterium]
MFSSNYAAPGTHKLTPPAVEELTQSKGRTLLAGLRREEKKIASPSDAFYDALMALTTADEKLKVELFRFVDALPALKSDESISRHLEEYLLQPGVTLPPGFDSLLKAAGAVPLSRKAVALSAKIGAEGMAKRFIAGRNAKEATGAVERLRRQHLTFTLDLLGEAVTSEAEAVAYQKKYTDLLTELPETAKRWGDDPQTDETPWGAIPKVNVSVKLSSLYARFDPMAAEATAEAVKERLRPILRLARTKGAFVNFDMEQHDFSKVTDRIFREVFTESEFADWADVGIVAQAYLQDAESDLRDLAQWVRRDRRGVPVTVRLVKGAYWDYETIMSAQRGHPVPVWQTKAETDACFERCTDFLLQNWQVLRPAIATHNVRSAAKAQALAESYGLAPRTAEFQVLFGMGESIGRALAAQGERVRVYVPFGELLPGMAYLVRRLLENTSNDSFVRKVDEEMDVAGLLADPVGADTVAPSPAPQERGDGEGVSGSVTIVGTSGSPLLRSGGGAGGGGNSDSPFHNEPETDFAEESNQRLMQNALASVRAKLGTDLVPVVIGGKREESAEIVERFDPSENSRVASRTYYATVEQAVRAVASAGRAFAGWRDTPVTERADLLRRTATELQRRRFEICATMCFEVGKPWREADADVAEAIDFCRFYAAEMERIGAPRRRNIPGEWNEYFYDARGPAVIIAPWNFPLAILAGMATAALVAGNPVILKPAEQSSRVGYFLQEALEAAGVPAGVSNFLPGDGEVIGPVLVNDPRTAVIAFTGSKAVGLSIIENAAHVRPGQREIKRVIAELGGKNAIIVDEDADLDEAVLGALQSATGFGGQKCSACSRVLVIGSAYEPFCHRLAEAVRTIKIGPAEDPSTTLGPVVDDASRERVEKYRVIGQSEGRLLAEQPVPENLIGRGNYVPALVFADCPAEGRLCQEEIFGPVLAVLRVKNMDEALSIADNTLYALTGGLYSRSPKNIARARREFRVGNLYINRRITGALVDRQPFGGARMSGIGSKAGGPDYVQQFLSPRTITESVLRRGFAPAAEGGE